MKKDARKITLKKRAYLLCLISAILCVLVFLHGAARAENLLYNGSFEEVDEEGLPVGWIPDAYNQDEGYSVFSVTGEDAVDGRMAAVIRNLGENDARFFQTVSVEPDSLYCFSGFIRTENVESGLGANLSIEGIYAFSESVYETSDGWEYIEWYGETGPDQTSVTLFARLGGYSGESTGKAWFDDLCLQEVDAVPGEGIASLWYREKRISYYDDDDDEADTSAASPAWPRLTILVLVWSAAAILILQWLRRREAEHVLPSSGLLPFILGLCLALLLRLVIAYFVLGYMVDVNCFTSWGNTMLAYGPVGFYPQSPFCDYPPAYTYILGLNAYICGLFPDAGSGVIRIIQRSIPSLCDILFCIVLDRFLSRYQGKVSSFSRRVSLLLLAFHPLTVLNSAAWGQMDSAFVLLLLLIAIWAIEGKWEFSLPCYMLSVLVKPQALMLGFLGLAAMILVWIREKPARRKMIVGILAALGILLLVVVPFSLRQDPFWIISQYEKTLASYPYATVNTANFYYLFQGNWRSIADSAPWTASLLMAAMTLGYGLLFLLRSRRKWRRSWIELMLSCVFSAFFVFCALAQFFETRIEVSWTWIGTGAMAFAFVIVLSLYIRHGKISFLPYLGGLLFLLLYVLGIKMHERYIFPALLFLALAYGVHRDRRILIVLISLTCTTFLNEGIVLDNSIRLGSSLGHLNQDTHVLAMILSAANLLITLYAVNTGVCLAVDEPVTAPSRRILQEPENSVSLQWKKKDSLILTLILVLYSVICFSTLGSTKAPQTAWTSSEMTENVVLDLGEKKDSFLMLYFARVSKYDFSVAVSEDGENWDEEVWAQMDQGQCWKWKYVTDSVTSADGSRSYGSSRHWFSGRYVRITAHQINLALCEVLFRDPEGNVLPVSLAGRNEGDLDSSLYSDPISLIDEQDTFEGLPVYFATGADQLAGEENPHVSQPSWWNSTYFDEIYHARTAWEFLNGSVPYETSHPPLGKILMSWGVLLFGMTPFGWRFAGATAGVLMLALIYLLAKQMTKKTWPALFACMLMALDCMHLTQTQIATIDSFPVLFILSAFFFMLRFLQTDWRKEKLSRVLVNLGLSGFCMGLAIASKWIGMYAGVGLAILFFWHLVRTVRTKEMPGRSKAGKKNPGKTPADGNSLRIIQICLWCVLFFVVIPVGIYLLCYLPYYAYRRFTSFSDYLQAVIQSQQGMLNYHSTPGLGMDHPFYSPWYEWPVIGKPMFYSTKQYIFNDELSFSIFSFGNPVVWWGGIPAVLFCVWGWIRNREEKLPHPMTDNACFASLDLNLIFVLIGFLAQYLPWTLVPRGTYIYHYFASVPFLIIALTLIMDQLERHTRKGGRIFASALILLAAGCFILFFPYASGILSPISWLEAGKGILSIWY